MMKKTAAILLTIYIIIQSIYSVWGIDKNEYWNCVFYLNQNYLIISILWLLKGFFNDILINIIIAWQAAEAVYNLIRMININAADLINNSPNICKIIVATIVFVLIVTLSKDDRRTKKRMVQTDC
jgi:hypothetical protein